MTTCKNCGKAITKKGKEWRHNATGFWKCFDRVAEPRPERKRG